MRASRKDTALQVVCVSVFGLEAAVKSQELSHLLGALALGGLFAVLVVSEHLGQD